MFIKLDRPEPGVALITFSNPPRNQMSADASMEFHRLLDELDHDTDLRCLVLTGTERSWCAGADLQEERQLTTEKLTAEKLDARTGSPTGFGALMNRLENNRVPVIAAINGHTVGGGMELALACDVRIGSQYARFMCAGVNVGLIASWYRLPRTIGLGPAKQMLLSGAMFDAEWAYRNGLITELYPEHELIEQAVALAHRIATRAPLSVEATKQSANRAFELDHDSAMALQKEKFLQMVVTSDHAEAVAAFLEKRPAHFHRR